MCKKARTSTRKSRGFKITHKGGGNIKPPPHHVKIALRTVLAIFFIPPIKYIYNEGSCSTLASKMWIWWPSKVLTLKLEYSTGRFSAKYDISLQNLQRAIKNWIQMIKLYFFLSMITNESLLVAKYFISWYKIRKNIFKLNRLVGLIFRNIEFWRPIRAEGRQHLTEYQMALKMVSKRPQRILMNLQLLIESVL